MFWAFDFGLCFVVFDVSSGVALILVLRVEVVCWLVGFELVVARGVVV